MSDLDGLLNAAREAEPGDRINLRDAIAGHAEAAIDAITDWLGDRRLAGFAIRVLEKIGARPEERQAVIATLAAVDRTGWPNYLVADLDRTLSTLGHRARSTRKSPARPPGTPGKPGRGYWVMRTSPWQRPYIWGEAIEGRLRQGWGIADEQNLNVIAETLRRGGQLSPLQMEARRALRMLSTWWGGMHVGDIVVAPNLPGYGRLSIFRVVGSYQWEPGPDLGGDRFGHVLPVELIEGDIGRWEPIVSDGLRSILRVQTRLYNITGYGGDVERLTGEEVPTDRRGEYWSDSDYETLFGLFSADSQRPSDAEFDELAIELGRTSDAVSWQWEDGASYVTGRAASTTSSDLKSWLDSRR